MNLFRRKKEINLLKEQLKGASLPVATKPTSIIAEQFRTIRTNIEYSMIDGDLKTLMVTSSTPFEGKTFASSNIATVFAAQGKKVLYVDADMRKSTAHRTFNIPNRVGLTTWLTSKEKNIDDCITYVKETGVYVLTSGPKPPNPAELLNSNKMTKLIEEVREKFELIIFDLPPMIGLTDAQIMATKTDGVIFIIRKDAADKKYLKKAKEQLDNVGANIIGAVFNGIDSESSSYYNGYYNGYYKDIEEE